MKQGLELKQTKLPVILGKIVLHKVFAKSNLVVFLYRFAWYACHVHARFPMNGSVDFFESLIEQDGRFAELNCQESHNGGRPRPRPIIRVQYPRRGASGCLKHIEKDAYKKE